MPAPMHNYKYLFEVLYLRKKKDTWIQFTTILQLSQSIYALMDNLLMDSQLNFLELPAILDSFLLAYPIPQALLQRWRVGVVGSHEVVNKGYVNTENSQMASIGVIFSSTYHTKQLNLWANSSASHAVKYSWLSACQWRWSHLKITQALMNV